MSKHAIYCACVRVCLFVWLCTHTMYHCCIHDIAEPNEFEKVEWKMLIAHHNCYRCKSINYYDRHIWVQAYQVLIVQYFTHFTRYTFSYMNTTNTLPPKGVFRFWIGKGSLAQLTHFKWLFFYSLFNASIVCSAYKCECDRSFSFSFSFTRLLICLFVCALLLLPVDVLCALFSATLVKCKTGNGLDLMLVTFCLINIYLNDFPGIH